MIKIAFYGKGGIGKSTIVSNLASAFTILGYKTLQIGCDPKGDSTILHTNNKKIKTVLESKGKNFISKGQDGVYVIECGGPKAGFGCAGQGISYALKILNASNLIEKEKFDIVLYDVLGDVVCGGFTAPIQKGNADYMYSVPTSVYNDNQLKGEFDKLISDIKNKDSVSINITSYNYEDNEELSANLTLEKTNTKLVINGATIEKSIQEDDEINFIKIILENPNIDKSSKLVYKLDKTEKTTTVLKRYIDINDEDYDKILIFIDDDELKIFISKDAQFGTGSYNIGLNNYFKISIAQ